MDQLNRASCERSGSLKEAYERTPTGDNKRGLADVLSVLAITTGKEGERESLRFRLEGSKVRAESACQGSNHFFVLMHTASTTVLRRAGLTSAQTLFWCGLRARCTSRTREHCTSSSSVGDAATRHCPSDRRRQPGCFQAAGRLWRQARLACVGVGQLAASLLTWLSTRC